MLFVKLSYDTTFNHIAKVKAWAKKWYAPGEISKEWKDYMYIENTQPGKNATLYKTHKPGNSVCLLTSGYNSAIENLSRCICAPLTCMPCRIKDTATY